MRIHDDYKLEDGTCRSIGFDDAGTVEGFAVWFSLSNTSERGSQR